MSRNWWAPLVRAPISLLNPSRVVHFHRQPSIHIVISFDKALFCSRSQLKYSSLFPLLACHRQLATSCLSLPTCYWNQQLDAATIFRCLPFESRNLSNDTWQKRGKKEQPNNKKAHFGHHRSLGSCCSKDLPSCTQCSAGNSSASKGLARQWPRYAAYLDS